MNAILKRYRELRRAESGLSMVEILVSMTLGLLLLALVASMFVNITKLTTSATQTRNSNGVAANAMNEMASVLRVATNLAVANQPAPASAIVNGTRSSLTVYTLANTTADEPAPFRVTFTLAAIVPATTPATYKLTEARCKGTPSGDYWTFPTTCPPANLVTRDFGTGFLPSTNNVDAQGIPDQLFTYRDANRTPIGLGTLGTDPLSGTQLPLVSSITINVKAQTGGTGSKVVQVRNTVVLRNLGLDTGTS